jgi:hypothetical protein
VDALTDLPAINRGVLSQLIFSASTEIETVTRLPLGAVEIELGLSVIIASLIFEPIKSC